MQGLKNEHRMSDTQPLSATFQTYMENPLLWPILEVLKQQPSGWKVHTLAAHLSELELVPVLDDAPEKDLFKRNFLIMNALYQLQEILYPQKWLQVEAMDIVLMPMFRNANHVIDPDEPLRDYYTNWTHYEASEGEVKRLLNEFWTRYRRFVGGKRSVTSIAMRPCVCLTYRATQHRLRFAKHGANWRCVGIRTVTMAMPSSFVFYVLHGMCCVKSINLLI